MRLRRRLSGDAEIVRHRIGDLAQAPHQLLDAVEHGIEIGGERVEFVIGLGDRNPARQIAGHDLLAGRVDAVEPLEQIAAHERPADQAQDQKQRHTPGQRGGEQALGLVALVDVAGDQKLEASGEREDAAAGPQRLLGCAGAADVIEFDELAVAGGDLGPAVEIAGDRAHSRISEEIERLPPADRARDDDLGQARQAHALVFFGQTRDLGLDDLVGLAVERALGVPIGETDDRARRQRKHEHIGQNDAEREGAK